MEVNQQVWLRRDSSHWGWVPAVVVRKDQAGADFFDLTLVNDPHRPEANSGEPDYFRDQEEFTQVVRIEKEQLKSAEHSDIKLRNLPSSFLEDDSNNASSNSSAPVGGVHDLIGLTHLHEPAILHALRLRYDSDIIYTSTGPILIAVNPFKPMPNLAVCSLLFLCRVESSYGLDLSLWPPPIMLLLHNVKLEQRCFFDRSIFLPLASLICRRPASPP